MSRFAFLIQATPELEDGNAVRLARAITRRGDAVDLLDIDRLTLHAGTVRAAGFAWRDDLAPGVPWPKTDTMTLDHPTVWVMGLGDRTSFLDKYQLLHTLPGRVINTPHAIMHLKSKYFLAVDKRFPSPETHASSVAAELIDIVRTGGDWIAKPPAGSLGRDVFRVSAADSNLPAIVQHLCGPDNNQYTLLQRYVSEIENGEKRVLVAGGRVIGQYLRRASGDHRTNLLQGAIASACELNHEEQSLCDRLAQDLLAEGAFYAGIDLCHPWLIETNVINPGGLTTIEELTGEDLTLRVLDAVQAALAAPRLS